VIVAVVGVKFTPPLVLATSVTDFEVSVGLRSDCTLTEFPALSEICTDSLSLIRPGGSFQLIVPFPTLKGGFVIVGKLSTVNSDGLYGRFLSVSV
jgi:hypothetical protein